MIRDGDASASAQFPVYDEMMHIEIKNANPHKTAPFSDKVTGDGFYQGHKQQMKRTELILQMKTSPGQISLLNKKKK